MILARLCCSPRTVFLLGLPVTLQQSLHWSAGRALNLACFQGRSKHNFGHFSPECSFTCGREAELQGDIPEISSGCFRVYLICVRTVSKVHLHLARAVPWVPDPKTAERPSPAEAGKGGALSSIPGGSARVLGRTRFLWQREGGRRRKVGEIISGAVLAPRCFGYVEGKSGEVCDGWSGADGEPGVRMPVERTCSRTSRLRRSCLRDLDARLYCPVL